MYFFLSALEKQIDFVTKWLVGASRNCCESSDFDLARTAAHVEFSGQAGESDVCILLLSRFSPNIQKYPGRGQEQLLPRVRWASWESDGGFLLLSRFSQSIQQYPVRGHEQQLPCVRCSSGGKRRCCFSFLFQPHNSEGLSQTPNGHPQFLRASQRSWWVFSK